MIGELSGKIARQEPSALILNVQGVGYHIHTTPNLALSTTEGEEVHLYTHLVVRENVLDLYGFATKEETDFFKLLISISGIGPRSAIAVLSLADINTLSAAASSGDTTYLTRVSGIGKKTAQKIVLELKDKLGTISFSDTDTGRQEDADVLDALEALGYSLSEARDALAAIPEEATSSSARLKAALQALGKK